MPLMIAAARWALVAHIVGVILWMGGLLIATQLLARLGQASEEARATLARLARKTLKSVAHPGAAVAVLAGIAMVVIQPAYLGQAWLHIKFALVVILIALDLLVTVRFRAYEKGGAEIRPRQARLAHASIALLFLAIAMVAVLKPFS